MKNEVEVIQNSDREHRKRRKREVSRNEDLNQDITESPEREQPREQRKQKRKVAEEPEEQADVNVNNTQDTREQSQPVIPKSSSHSRLSNGSKNREVRITGRRTSITSRGINKTGAVSVAMQILNMTEEEKA